MIHAHDPTIRATALAALARNGAATAADLSNALADPSPIVRRRVATIVARTWSDVGGQVALGALLDDADPTVVEVACFAAGECEPPDPGIVERLSEIATSHDDALCRESAVAALGALGDEQGRDAVLAGCRDKVTVRRRAVLALAAFEGPDIDAVLTEMATDVDWQVRQAAEELLAIE